MTPDPGLNYYQPMLTDINDIVLVHINDNPAFFARLEEIEPDVKPEWWQVKLLVLQMPIKTITWILRDAYIQGDTFTMGGTPIRLERIEAPVEEEELGPDEQLLRDTGLDEVVREAEDDKAKKPATVISLAERFKKQSD